MGNLRYLTKEGFRNLKVNKLMSFSSITVLFSCLMIIGIAFMIFVNIQTVVTKLEKENVIKAFAYMDSTDAEYRALGRELEAIRGVSEVEAIEKEEAFAKQLETLPDNLKEYYSNLDENPLPDGYKVTVEDMEYFDAVVKEIEGLESVDTYHHNSEVATKINTIKNTVTYVSIGLIVLLLIVSLFIISNTIKVTMFNRRLEISIMKSVGATNSFIRWPFVVEGIIMGVVAGILSTGAVWLVYKFAISEIMKSLINEEVFFINYAPWVLIVFIVVGVLTGVFGSLTSIRKYLKERKFVELED